MNNIEILRKNIEMLLKDVETRLDAAKKSQKLTIVDIENIGGSGVMDMMKRWAEKNNIKYQYLDCLRYQRDDGDLFMLVLKEVEKRKPQMIIFDEYDRCPQSIQKKIRSLSLPNLSIIVTVSTKLNRVNEELDDDVTELARLYE